MERKIFLIVFIAFILVLGLGFFYNKLFVFGQWGYGICPKYKCEERWGPPAPPECYNAAIPGERTYCGPACPYMYYPSSYKANVGYELGNGLPWAKYEITSDCIAVPAFPEEPICFWQTNIIGSSLGDKLEPYCPNCGWGKNGYLAAGLCQPWESGGFYKVCCGPDGRVEPSAISNFELDNINPPTEGYCPNDPYGIRVGYSSYTRPNVGEIHPACGGGGGGGGGGAPPPPGCPPGYVLCDDGQCWGGCPSGWRTECIPGDGAKCVAETPPPPPPSPPPPSCPNGECSSPGSKICVDLGRYKECRWDPAVGKNCWSDPISCPPRQTCQGNQCVPKQEIVRTETCNFQGTF
jgi:hypothetical protein